MTGRFCTSDVEKLLELLESNFNINDQFAGKARILLTSLEQNTNVYLWIIIIGSSLWVLCFKDGVSGIPLVLVMEPFMFVGFDTFVQVAKEIDLPFRDSGAVLLASVAMAIVWYGLIVLAVGLVLD